MKQSEELNIITGTIIQSLDVIIMDLSEVQKISLSDNRTPEEIAEKITSIKKLKSIIETAKRDVIEDYNQRDEIEF